MIEIKFRACRVNMETDDGIRTMMTEPFTLGSLQDREQFDFTDGSYLSADEFGLEHPETTLIQYTGLKDRSGKEIYEGDVLKFPEGTLGYVMPLEDGAFRFKRKEKPVLSYWLCNLTNGINNVIDNIEVLGNIHEHPELLN